MHTSAVGSGAEGGGDRGSFNSGIGSCVVPFAVLELGPSSVVGSVVVPFGLSALVRRVCFGEFEASELREIRESLLDGDAGMPEDDPGGSRSAVFDLLFPKLGNDEPRFVLDFRSGDKARPYGCALCRRRPRTVPNRFRPCNPTLCFIS